MTIVKHTKVKSQKLLKYKVLTLKSILIEMRMKKFEVQNQSQQIKRCMKKPELFDDFLVTSYEIKSTPPEPENTPAILEHNQCNQIELSGMAGYEVAKSVKKEPESTSFANNQNVYQTLTHPGEMLDFFQNRNFENSGNFNEMTSPDSYMTEQQTIIQQPLNQNYEFEIPMNNGEYCQL